MYGIGSQSRILISICIFLVSSPVVALTFPV